MREIMKYSIYEKMVKEYVIGEYGSLDVLKSDLLLRDEVSRHMLKEVLAFCSTQEIQAGRSLNKKYFQKFIASLYD